MRAIVFGSTGKLGSELTRQLVAAGWLVRGFNRTYINLLNPKDKIHQVIAGDKPDVVINCAAFNGMEACAENPAAAYSINSAAPAIMADATAKIGAMFIHFSTDYVFEGDGNSGYPKFFEDSLPVPVSVYARSKYLGDQGVSGVRRSDPRRQFRHRIFRVSSLYDRNQNGPLGPLAQFEQGMGTQKDPIVYFEQDFTPTSVETVATAVIHSLQETRDKFGIYNLVTSGVTSRRQFAEHQILHVHGVNAHTALVNLEMRRPRRVVLDNPKFERVFGYKLPTWEEDFARMFPKGASVSPCPIPHQPTSAP